MRATLFLFISYLLLQISALRRVQTLSRQKVSILTISAHTPVPLGQCVFYASYGRHTHTHTHTHNLILMHNRLSCVYHLIWFLSLLSHCPQNILLVQRQVSVNEEDLDDFRKVLKSYVDATSAHSDNLQSVVLHFIFKLMFYFILFYFKTSGSGHWAQKAFAVLPHSGTGNCNWGESGGH